jgi:hypothetical protein
LLFLNFAIFIIDFANIKFNGFDITLPEETLIVISELAQQVGSPSYIRTPVFQKRDNPATLTKTTDNRRRRNGNKGQEVNDEDWEMLRQFQTTTIEQKVGVDADIDAIRVCLNKMTDKNYADSFEQIIQLLNRLTSDSDMERVGDVIFEIASNNRFYSKLYADLYTSLIDRYNVMRVIFNINLDSFMELFVNIEHVDAEKDYDKFCRVNKDNERRKALSLFFVNLTVNKIIAESQLQGMVFSLLTTLLIFMKEDNRKNEVDEITENISILYSYNKQMFDSYTDKQFDGETFSDVVHMLANSKAKTYPSLSSKSIFKFMDLIEM